MALQTFEYGGSLFHGGGGGQNTMVLQTFEYLEGGHFSMVGGSKYHGAPNF